MDGLPHSRNLAEEWRCGPDTAVELVLLWSWYCCGAGTAVELVLLWSWYCCCVEEAGPDEETILTQLARNNGDVQGNGYKGLNQGHS